MLVRGSDDRTVEARRCRAAVAKHELEQPFEFCGRSEVGTVSRTVLEAIRNEDPGGRRREGRAHVHDGLDPHVKLRLCNVQNDGSRSSSKESKRVPGGSSLRVRRVEGDADRYPLDARDQYIGA
jgi:hypothetical protein